MLLFRLLWILTCMKLVIELIKFCGDFGLEFLIDICYGKWMYLKRFSTKLFCVGGQIVYACIVCIMCTWYPSNAQKNIIMLFLNLLYRGLKGFCMVSLGKLILAIGNFLLNFLVWCWWSYILFQWQLCRTTENIFRKHSSVKYNNKSIFTIHIRPNLQLSYWVSKKKNQPCTFVIQICWLLD